MLTNFDYAAWGGEVWQHIITAAQWLGWFIHEYREEIIAVFTVILAVATWRLWIATRNLVRGTERTAQSQLRAYVSVESGGVQHGIVDGQPGFQVHVVLKNYGVTPAYRFRTWINAPVILDTGAVPFIGPTVPLEDRPPSILGPGSLAHMHWNAVFPMLAVQDIRSGTKAIFVWGGADYIDAFGHPRHFMFRCAMSGSEDSPNGWALKPHRIGYEAN